MKMSRRSKSILQTGVLIVIMCVLMAIMTFLGMWIPNRFGSGALWLIVAVLFGIWAWNTYADNVIIEEAKLKSMEAKSNGTN